MESRVKIGRITLFIAMGVQGLYHGSNPNRKEANELKTYIERRRTALTL